MNMLVQPQRTPAETALVDAFAERVASLPGDPSVLLKRDAAIEAVKAGLPTRRIESWHYTDFRRLLTSVPPYDPAAAAAPVAPVVAGSTVLAMLNGVASAKAAAPAGVAVRRLEEMLLDGSFAAALDPQGDDDAVGAINAAFAADGYFLDVEAGAAPVSPIELQNVQAGGQTHVRLPVRVGAGARVTLVERQTGSGAALVSSVSHLDVGEGADVRWLIVQDQPDGATHLGQFNARLGKDAKLTLFFLNAGGRLVRQEVRVSAAGEGSSFTLRGVNLLAGDSHTDVTMVLDHAVPATVSTEVVRNVVTGRARGVFQGRINVHQDAQKTDAKMACNTLLLSDEGEFSTKPELEIFADDVLCGHGATVADIDRNHMYYMMTRGVPEKTARAMLVYAFVAQIVEELEEESLVEALEGIISAWLEKHA